MVGVSPRKSTSLFRRGKGFRSCGFAENGEEEISRFHQLYFVLVVVGPSTAEEAPLQSSGFRCGASAFDG